MATFPDDLADAQVLLHLADQALYQAKRLGRDRVCRAAARAALADPPMGG